MHPAALVGLLICALNAERIDARQVAFELGHFLASEGRVESRWIGPVSHADQRNIFAFYSPATILDAQ